MAQEARAKWEGGIVLYAGGTDYSKVGRVRGGQGPVWAIWRQNRAPRRPHTPPPPVSQLGRSGGKKQTDAEKQVRRQRPCGG